MQYSDIVNSYITTKFLGTLLHENIIKMRSEILTNNITNASVVSGIIWFDNMTQQIDLLGDLIGIFGNVSHFISFPLMFRVYVKQLSVTQWPLI